MSRQMLFCTIAAVLGLRSVSADASVSVALDFIGGDNPADGYFKEADSICKSAAIAELQRKGFPVVPLDPVKHKTPAIRFLFSEVYVWGSKNNDGVNFQWDKMIPVITLSWELSDNTAAHSIIFSHPILVLKDGEEQDVGEACSGAIDLFVRDNKPFT